MTSKKVKYLSMKELIEGGYLQELNRQLLHPLGLALEVTLDEGHPRGGYVSGVWDSREDPEGFAFGELGPEEARKAALIRREWKKRKEARIAALGYLVQPITAKAVEASQHTITRDVDPEFKPRSEPKKRKHDLAPGQYRVGRNDGQANELLITVREDGGLHIPADPDWARFPGSGNILFPGALWYWNKVDDDPIELTPELTPEPAKGGIVKGPVPPSFPRDEPEYLAPPLDETDDPAEADRPPVVDATPTGFPPEGPELLEPKGMIERAEAVDRTEFEEGGLVEGSAGSDVVGLHGPELVPYRDVPKSNREFPMPECKPPREDPVEPPAGEHDDQGQ